MSVPKKNNIFNVSDIKNNNPQEEIFENLFKNENLRIERIISSGQFTPENEWLVQDIDEWVILLQGESVLKFYNNQTINLSKGDYIHIPANTKHRVEHTSNEPICIWLAVHYMS
ncbi:MAG: cupin domain-containing protein [Bacteroidota bacterium]|nr:cupin domain-containing protein [Bacteroidota bacterium]